MMKSIFQLCLLLILTVSLTAQDKKLDFTVKSSHGELLGTTKKIDVWDDSFPQSSDEKRAFYKKQKKPLNFVGRRSTDPNKPIPPHALPKGEDPVRQKSFSRSSGREAEIKVNIEGLGQGSPTDPCGDIGQDHYVQEVNATSWRIYNKDGTPASGIMNADVIWSQIGQNGIGDPIILYDQENDRWILSEFIGGSGMLVGISDDSDPAGPYTAYLFATANFPDYPKLALWDNTIYMTTNEEGTGTATHYFIDREAVLNGDDAPAIVRFTTPGAAQASWYTPTPVDWTGDIPIADNTPPMILHLIDDFWGFDRDGIDIYEFNVDFENPNNSDISVVEVDSAPFTADDSQLCAALGAGFACIPQPNGQGIDAIPHVIMHQAHYRNFGSHEAMVVNFVVDAGDTAPLAGIRWMELRRTPGTEWSVYQEGTFAPDDGEHRFMGAIAMDGRGNIGLCYTVSSENTFPSLRFTGRFNGDPLGEMTLEEVEFAAGVGSNNGARFGDYAQLSIDPEDDATFWYTGEYLGTANSARTRIFAFEMSRDSIDIGPSDLVTPTAADLLSDSEVVTADITNFGLTTQDQFRVSLEFEGDILETDEVNFTLEPDATYTHTFDTPVDMSVINPYSFRIITSLDGDVNFGNDSLTRQVRNLPSRDVEVISINTPPGAICSDADLEVVFSNQGFQTLTSANFDISVNGNSTSFPWTGEVAFMETGSFSFPLIGLQGGDNTIEVEARSPNGGADQDLSNNSTATTVEYIDDPVEISLNLLTDNFPEETTWEVTNLSGGGVIASGGPYPGMVATQIVETFCGSQDDCFIFRIFDSFGDGICCAYGQGSYTITGTDGAPLASSTGEFGFEESIVFCSEFMCTMTSSVEITPATGPDEADGLIMITTENAPGDIIYSIDGGATFQASSIFAGVPPGDYDIVVESTFGCVNTETVSLGFCDLNITAEVTDASAAGVADGTINLVVTGGTPPYSYSLDNGASFQDNPLFENLIPAIYFTVVRDSEDCEIALNVEVQFATSTDDGEVSSHQFIATPNPTEGIFKVFLDHPDVNDLFTTIEILDINGKLVQTKRLAKWDGVYEGTFSLVAWPSGVYLIRARDKNVKRVLRVIKQ